MGREVFTISFSRRNLYYRRKNDGICSGCENSHQGLKSSQTTNCRLTANRHGFKDTDCVITAFFTA
ncbi:hypothetical protein ABIB48_000409 [Arthrobacter sp. UYCu511]